MRVILYMAVTVNGLIARENDDTSWVSKEEWKSFQRMIKRAGNIIVGRRACEIMARAKEPVPPCQVLSVSSQGNLECLAPQGTLFFPNPQSALDFLEGKKFKTALVAGGAHLNASFLSQNLVDELYLDVEPVLIGKGIPLLVPSDVERKLKFIGAKRFGEGIVQLHYRVKK
ncbi:MAG: dihydrofolate reductase [Candidatus Diapherotrites archaeon]|nr:dihydrofolate reductase [Candidatus Diapherotrites archaeon]